MLDKPVIKIGLRVLVIGLQVYAFFQDIDLRLSVNLLALALLWVSTFFESPF